MPAPEVLAHHPFTRSEEVEGGSQPCGRDLLLGHPVKRITRVEGSDSAPGRPGTFSFGGGRFPAGSVNQEMNV